MKALPQPSLNTIEEELTAYRKWWEAHSQKIEPLPELPAGDAESPSEIMFLGGSVLRIPLWCLGWVARECHLSNVRIWAVRKLIASDRFSLEPNSCSLNSALTELGLALFEAGDRTGATDCLRRSWQVHPCPHNVSFGLETGLWRTLKSIEESTEARAEYQAMARKFRLGAEWPRPKLNLSFRRRISSVLRALLSLRK